MYLLTIKKQICETFAQPPSCQKCSIPKFKKYSNKKWYR